ncbi:MAG: DUF58 domain-containing protein [Candidatus Altiarchaeota archaeon]|nr:DUF58 domain-containing protein [Candidatus Altiarchaeota archaeon]
MKRNIRALIGRFFLGMAFFLFSLLPLRTMLMNIRLSDPNADFAFVLFAIAFPHIIRFISIGILSHTIFLMVKIMTMPRSLVERSLYRLRKKKIFKNLVYISIILAMFLFPGKSGTAIQVMANNLFNALPLGFMVLYPFFIPIGFMDILLFAQAFLIASFLLHVIKILSLRFATIETTMKQKVTDRGKKVKLTIHAKSPLPLISKPVFPFKVKQKSKSSFFGNKYSINIEGDFEVGYYRYDVMKYQIATFPFFFSNVFKATNNPAEFTVLPKIKVKNSLYVKNPFIVRETGDLIKKVSGSSLEFAGIKEFAPGDPPSKIWWKGLAKDPTKLLKKDFFNPAEDRWILMIDLSDPDMKKEDETAILNFSRAFIEIFTRKDIEVAIHLISPTSTFINYSSRKRDLLSFLIKHWVEFKHLSHDGAKLILKDVIGKDSEVIEERCRAGGISLSSFLIYSGLMKKPKQFFQWRRKRIVANSLMEITKGLKKSGKMLVVTPGMTEEMVDDIKKVARAKHCRLLFTSFEKIPRAKSYVISRKAPESSVWRLIYA